MIDVDQDRLRKAIALCLGVGAAGTVTMAVRQQHLDALTPALAAHRINTCDRVAAIMAQFAHETGGFIWLRELGGATYFLKYDGRMGNSKPGDGYRYRGRGYIHLTGLANYREMEKKTGLPLLTNPDLIENPKHAALVSALWWDEHDMNHYADLRDFRKITQVINGGLNGLTERMKWYSRMRGEMAKAGVCDD